MLSSKCSPLFCLGLAANRVFILSEIIEDLRRLCVVFEHVEKLLTVAASLHRKFLQAPRLSEVIFSDYYNFYQPKMGSGSVGGSGDVVILKSLVMFLLQQFSSYAQSWVGGFMEVLL